MWRVTGAVIVLLFIERLFSVAKLGNLSLYCVIYLFRFDLFHVKHIWYRPDNYLVHMKLSVKNFSKFV